MFVFNVDERGLVTRNISAWRLSVKSKLKATNINMAETEKSVKIEEGDPQSVQDLTGFVPFDVQYVRLFFNFIPGLYVLFISIYKRVFSCCILPIVLGAPFGLFHQRFI